MLSGHELNDPYRLRRIRSIGILDTPAEAHFDSLAEFTAKLLRFPVALVNFVDDVRTWCKAAWGDERKHYPHSESICSTTLAAGDSLIIRDTHADPLYRQHPNVTDDRRVRFYAGVVLRTSDGVALGTLCVIDHVVREASEDDILTLRKVAQQLIRHLEAAEGQLRVKSLADQLDAARKNRDQFLAMLAHELRAPLLTAVQILNRKGGTLDQRMWAKSLIYRHVRIWVKS